MQGVPCPEDVKARCPHGEAPATCPWCAAAAPPAGLDRDHLGLSVWPCSYLLAAEASRREWAGLDVVEVGCGVAEPSGPVWAGGATVTLADNDLAVYRQLLGSPAEVLLLSWEAPPPRRWDSVIGSDLLARDEDAEPLARFTAAAWTGKGPLLFALPRRGRPELFGEALARGTGREIKRGELYGTLPDGRGAACDLWEVS